MRGVDGADSASMPASCLGQTCRFGGMELGVVAGWGAGTNRGPEPQEHGEAQAQPKDTPHSTPCVPCAPLLRGGWPQGCPPPPIRGARHRPQRRVPPVRRRVRRPPAPLPHRPRGAAASSCACQGLSRVQGAGEGFREQGISRGRAAAVGKKAGGNALLHCRAAHGRQLLLRAPACSSSMPTHTHKRT